MSKTVEIIKKWVDFETVNPNASIEDFCKNYLYNLENAKNSTLDLNCKSEN